MLDLLLFIYIGLIVISVLIQKGGKTDYLALETTTSLRGIAAIGIILHHLSERTHNGILFCRLMPMSGYILVTFFFFLSGYGLVTQYMVKKENYLNGFIQKRVSYLLIIYCLDIIIYTIIGNIMGKGYSLWDMAQSLFNAKIPLNAWYMVVQILFYVFFYISFVNNKISLEQKIIVVFVLQTCFLVYCLVRGISNTWYLSNYGFSLGMIWARNEKIIREKLQMRYLKVFAMSLVAFLFFYLLPVFTDHICQESIASPIRIVCRLISSPLSGVVVMVIVYKCCPITRIWKHLGTMSLEIYLIHGLVYTYLRGPWLFIENEFLWTVMTIILTIVIAVPMHVVDNKISLKIKDMYMLRHNG